MEFVGFVLVQSLYWKRDPSWLVPIHKNLCNNQVSSWKMEKVSRYLWKFHRIQMEENIAYLPSTLHLIIVTSRFRNLQKQGPARNFKFPVGSRIWFLWNLPVMWKGNCKDPGLCAMDVCFKPTRFEAEGFFSKYGPTNYLYPPGKRLRWKLKMMMVLEKEFQNIRGWKTQMNHVELQGLKIAGEPC